jgi:hypothetical protein
MKIAKVFPRKTKATPEDDLSFVGDPPLLFPPEIDKVEISVTFEWDLQEADRLKKEWSVLAPVEIGGPATGMRGEGFTPGQYVKEGYVITSRGCRNRCWFCSVWRREGDIRELPITEGWNVLDDNLLATSWKHQMKVYRMLKKQSERIQFTGGLEAALLRPWHIGVFEELKPDQMFFAYDTPDDKEPLFEAGKMLRRAGFTDHHLRAYVLIGFPKDTFALAEKRLYETLEAGFIPMAMLYRDKTGYKDEQWKKFQREWARPAIIKQKVK